MTHPNGVSEERRKSCELLAAVRDSSHRRWVQSLRSAVERAQKRQGLGLKKGKGAVIVSHSFLRLH